MVAMTEARPEVRIEEIRCKGIQKNGVQCNRLLARIHGPFSGRLDLRCPICHTDRKVDTPKQ